MENSAHNSNDILVRRLRLENEKLQQRLRERNEFETNMSYEQIQQIQSSHTYLKESVEKLENELRNSAHLIETQKNEIDRLQQRLFKV